MVFKIFDPNLNVIRELTPKAQNILETRGVAEFFRFMYCRARQHATNLQEAIELWQYTLEVVEAFARYHDVPVRKGWYAHLGSLMDPNPPRPRTSRPLMASSGRTPQGRTMPTSRTNYAATRTWHSLQISDLPRM